MNAGKEKGDMFDDSLTVPTSLQMIYSLRSATLESNGFRKSVWNFLRRIQDKELKFLFPRVYKERAHLLSP